MKSQLAAEKMMYVKDIDSKAELITKLEEKVIELEGVLKERQEILKQEQEVCICGCLNSHLDSRELSLTMHTSNILRVEIV